MLPRPPGPRAGPEVQEGYERLLYPEPFELGFRFQGWNIASQEDWKDYRKKVETCVAAALAQWLEQYRRRQQVALKDLEPWPAKREWEQHFWWLALYQVDGQSHSQIGREENADRRTIQGAVRGAAEMIGLGLRSPSNGGRPKGGRPGKRKDRCRVVDSLDRVSALK